MSNQPPVRLTLYEEKLREELLAFQLPAEQRNSLACLRRL